MVHARAPRGAVRARALRARDAHVRRARRACAGAPAASCATACRCRSASSARSRRRSSRSPADAAALRAGTLGARALALVRRLPARARRARRATSEFLSAWWVMIGGTHPERGAVVDALAAIAAHGGTTGLLTTLRHAPAEGWSALAERMAASPGVEVRYGAELRSRAPGRARRRARRWPTARRAGAPRAVLALPVNTLPAVGFAPPLPGGDRRGARHRTPAARTRSGCAPAACRRACSPPARGRVCTGSTPIACSTAATCCCSASATRTMRFDPADRGDRRARAAARSSPRPSSSRSTTTTGTPIRSRAARGRPRRSGSAELLTARALPAARARRVRDGRRRAARGRAGSRARCSPAPRRRAGRSRTERATATRWRASFCLVDLDAETGARGHAHEAVGELEARGEHVERVVRLRDGVLAVGAARHRRDHLQRGGDQDAGRERVRHALAAELEGRLRDAPALAEAAAAREVGLDDVESAAHHPVAERPDRGLVLGRGDLERARPRRAAGSRRCPRPRAAPRASRARTRRSGGTSRARA